MTTTQEQVSATQQGAKSPQSNRLPRKNLIMILLIAAAIIIVAIIWIVSGQGLIATIISVIFASLGLILSFIQLVPSEKREYSSSTSGADKRPKQIEIQASHELEPLSTSENFDSMHRDDQASLDKIIAKQQHTENLPPKHRAGYYVNAPHSKNVIVGVGNRINHNTNSGNPTQAPSKIKARADVPQVDVLLVTATDIEAKALFRVFPKYEPYFEGNNAYYDFGPIGGAKVFMVQSDMGSGGVGGSFATVSESIQTLSPAAIIMLGIAFGINRKQQSIGDVLVSKQIQDYEFQRVSTSVDGEQFIVPRGSRPDASIRLLNRFHSGAHSWQGSAVQFGLLFSGAKVVDNKEFKEQLCKLAPEAIGGEMEGAGLYAAAQRAQVDWILVKAICDWADGSKNANKDYNQQQAANNAAGFTMHVLQQGGVHW